MEETKLNQVAVINENKELKKKLDEMQALIED